ncbi:MAG: class I SAM-dependent methyltransferase [Pirellulaceae bacterium]
MRRICLCRWQLSSRDRRLWATQCPRHSSWAANWCAALWRPSGCLGSRPLRCLASSKLTKPIFAMCYRASASGLARNDKGAYEYLPNSVIEFPSGRALAERMEQAGLSSIAIHTLTFGVASLYIGQRSAV